MLSTSVEDTILVFTTLTTNSNTQGKTGDSECLTGLALSSEGLFENLLCSGHGSCKQGMCVCQNGYTGNNCAEVQEIQRDSATRSEWLLHSDWQMLGMLTGGESELTAWKTAIREMVALQMSIPVSFVQIREWTLFHTQLPTLVHVTSRNRMSTVTHTSTSTSFLLNLKLSCVIPAQMTKADEAMVSERISTMLNLTSFRPLSTNSVIQVTSSKLLRTALQKTSDAWTCYDGRVGQDESDVDCGGSCIARCGSGMKCEDTSDCLSSLSCYGGVCNTFTISSFALSLIVAVTVVSAIAVVMLLYHIRHAHVRFHPNAHLLLGCDLLSHL